MDQEDRQHESRRGELSIEPLTTGTGSQSWWTLPAWSQNVRKQYVNVVVLEWFYIVFVSTWWNFTRSYL